MNLYDRITFNLFTNCTINSPKIFPINILFKSLLDTFNLDPTKIKINIFIDNNPYKKNYDNFLKNLKKYFSSMKTNAVFYKTKSLVDGFAKTFDICDTQFIFNLEHDWIFYKRNIMHTLDEILNSIQDEEVSIVKLHSHSIREDTYSKKLNKTYFNNIKYYQCSSTSNYCQIINRERYKKKYLKLIDLNAIKSYGIESNLQNVSDNYIYASKNNLRAIQHINGRIKNGFENKYGEICQYCGLSKADVFECSIKPIRKGKYYTH